MEKNNMSFKELINYIFAPESYTIYDYKNIKDCNFSTIFAYLSDSVLLRKIK